MAQLRSITCHWDMYFVWNADFQPLSTRHTNTIEAVIKDSFYHRNYLL